MEVRLGGVDFPMSALALSISAIFQLKSTFSSALVCPPHIPLLLLLKPPMHSPYAAPYRS